MEQSFANNNSGKKLNDEEKKLAYENFLRQYKGLIEDEKHPVSVMANTAAAIKEAFGFFWVGFYIVEECDDKTQQLVLGPFQGSVACYRISKGRGVCGTAWEKECSQVVYDVELFPGHIACSSLSRSEIVIPIFHNGVVKGVLDIDSDEIGTFDETDRIYLEKTVGLLASAIYE